MKALIVTMAGALLATASLASAQTTTKTTVTTKANPAMVSTRHVTTTRTVVKRHMTNVPVGHGISLARAERIAVRARPGRITHHRMEKERGGLAYSFDIRSHGRFYEVDVNRHSGSIVENRRELHARA